MLHANLLSISTFTRGQWLSHSSTDVYSWLHLTGSTDVVCLPIWSGKFKILPNSTAAKSCLGYPEITGRRALIWWDSHRPSLRPARSLSELLKSILLLPPRFSLNFRQLSVRSRVVEFSDPQATSKDPQSVLSRPTRHYIHFTSSSSLFTDSGTICE